MASTSFLSIVRTSFFVAACAAVAACGSSSAAPAPAPASAKLSDIRVNIFSGADGSHGSCALSTSCHQGSSVGGIDLTGSRKSADLIADLKKPAKMNAGQGPLAVPGNPDMSFLIHKLNADLPCFKDGSCGGPMPLTGPKIPAADIQAIHDWIAGGMQDN